MDNRIQEILDILQEECAEVIQNCCTDQLAFILCRDAEKQQYNELG